jgi:uncharacterized protein with PIN domain
MGKKIHIRFYEELNDFLPKNKRKTTYILEISSHQNIKDIIEAEGIPHAEVDLILANDESVGFEYRPAEGDRFAVYPVFESLDISSITRLRPKPLREIKFILDVHLGKLVRYLRMLGFDCYYRNDLEDDFIVEKSLEQKRIILTRDLQLLKNGRVTHGYFVRSTDPKKQLVEVIKRFDLKKFMDPFSICMECNGRLKKADKSKIEHKLEEGTRSSFDIFYQCEECEKIYWAGSHFEKMQNLIKEL